MKLLHVTSITNPRGNGVAVAVANYFKYERKLVDVAIYNVEKNIIEDNYSYNKSDYEDISSLPDGFDSPDLVIFNEVYKPIFLKLYKECLKKRVPYIIIPHGCLTKESQKKSKLKKTIANKLLFDKFIKKSIAVQYLNIKEQNESIVKNHKSIISGNGVDIQKKRNKYKNKDFVYIGRYCIEVKGLDLLMSTIIKNKQWFVSNGVGIRLYGRDANNGREELERIIKNYNLSKIVSFDGAVYEKDKEKVLLESYVFVQTSRHEGQPTGIMEALAYGVPCIVTEGTSFADYVNEKKCGIGIPFSKDALFGAMRKMVEDEIFRNECAKNTKSVKKDYYWPYVIKECLKKYESLL